MTAPDSPNGRTRLAAKSEPDAHGQAALMLAESTLHALVETSTLTLAEAVAVVRTAAEVKRDVATQAGESEKRMLESLALLSRIQSSLEADASPVPRITLLPDKKI